MDEQLLDLMTKHDALFFKLGAVLGNVSPYGKTQAQRTRQNRIRAKQRNTFKKELRDNEKLIVMRCFELRDTLPEEPAP